MSELLYSFQLMIIVIILLLITRIFIALGVYFDADSKGLKNKSLFGVMTFFFGIIMLIIYLCIRNSAERVQPKVCNRCHNIVHPAVKFCPKCNTAFFTYYQIPDSKNKKLKSNSFFILVVVFLLLAVYIHMSLPIIFGILLINLLMNLMINILRITMNRILSVWMNLKIILSNMKMANKY